MFFKLSYWSAENQTCQTRKSWHSMCEKDGHCLASELLVCNNVTKQCECSDTTFE